MVSKLLLTDKYSDCKYFEIYFNSLGIYQEYFLSENKDWIQKFLTNLYLDQLHVYPSLLSVLKKNHNSFYKELITDGYFIATAFVISLAPATKFQSIQEFIRVLGNDKEKLLKNLNWETLANAANKAEVANFGQLEAILNALGNDKEKLVKNLNWETLANAANKAEVSNIRQIADFIITLGSEKDFFTVFLNSDAILNFSNEISDNQIGSFCTIIASFQLEKRNEFIANINWVSMLKKLTTYYKYQIKALAYVLFYQNQKSKIFDIKMEQEVIRKYLNDYEHEIIRFSTQYFIAPDDFQSCSNLLAVLIPHSLEICRNIADNIKYKIINDFEISPRYYQSFSNLLNSLNQISSPISKNIIVNNSVKSKLHASFEDKSINDQLEGLKSLLDSMKNIDLLVTADILALQSIKDLKLDGIENKRTNENLNGI
jgi:predicted transcriptional regulator